MGNNKKNSFTSISFIFIGTLIASITIFIVSEVYLRSVPFFLSFLLLIIIIFIGIIFDIIGIAAATASPSGLHAKAAKKIPGAKEAIYLIKNADKVASFCNDVIGDISGTISGAMGATIVYKFIILNPSFNKLILSSIMAGIVASITVTGKAFGKSFAINKSSEIVFFVGKILRKINDIFYLKFLHRSR